MKINLNNTSLQKALRGCLSILNELRYSLSHYDETNGIISAVKNKKHVQIIDLKLTNKGNNVTLVIFPGIFSKDFECLSHDVELEKLFREKLIDYLQEENSTNQFRLEKKDYLYAKAL